MTKYFSISLTLFLITFSTPSLAGLYKCKDSNGQISYQQQPCDSNNKSSKQMELNTRASVSNSASSSVGGMIYGSWSGKASYENSYTAIIGKLPDPKKHKSSMPMKGTRSVKLNISKQECKIAFDLELDCIYKPDQKVIIIPSWRNDESEYDSGLMVTKLSNSQLELKNEYKRSSRQSLLEYEGIKYEMNGVELYSLTKDQ